MIGSLRNFAKTKLAGVLVFIIIIPFVFWGMGSMFNSGNSNNIAKINNTNVSTQDFIDYLNSANIPRKTIQEKMNEGIVEELLSTLISTTLLDLEVKDFDIIISEKTLTKKIKNNKSFLDENNVFQRTEYEKFLLSNNMTAPGFEVALRDREKQKHLFDYIGAGSITPKFLIDKNFKEQNNKLTVKYFPLQTLYKSEDKITKEELETFVEENKDQLKQEYIDFSYVLVNPKNLVGLDEFNQAFFDKIDFIENEISKDVDFNSILSNLELKPTTVKDFSLSNTPKEIEDKIFNAKSEKTGLLENNNDYILYNIDNVITKSPDLTNEQSVSDMKKLVFEKNKFDFNRKILEEINNKSFNDAKFDELGSEISESITLNSIKDNKKFNINSVRVLYSLPVGSFTLISDDQNNIYLSKNESLSNEAIDYESPEYKSFAATQLSNDRKNILQSYDTFLNDKYTVDVNKQTLERVKNYFK
jgi:peptidyl-prolyl cis-trans isomerase D